MCPLGRNYFSLLLSQINNVTDKNNWNLFPKCCYRLNQRTLMTLGMTLYGITKGGTVIKTYDNMYDNGIN